MRLISESFLEIELTAISCRKFIFFHQMRIIAFKSERFSTIQKGKRDEDLSEVSKNI